MTKLLVWALLPSLPHGMRWILKTEKVKVFLGPQGLMTVKFTHAQVRNEKPWVSDANHTISCCCLTGGSTGRPSEPGLAELCREPSGHLESCASPNPSNSDHCPFHILPGKHASGLGRKRCFPLVIWLISLFLGCQDLFCFVALHFSAQQRLEQMQWCVALWPALQPLCVAVPSTPMSLLKELTLWEAMGILFSAYSTQKWFLVLKTQPSMKNIICTCLVLLKAIIWQ